MLAVERIRAAAQAGEDADGNTLRVAVKHKPPATGRDRLLCWLVQSPGRVTEIYVWGEAPARELLSHIDSFGELRSLEINSRLVTDEIVPKFATLRHLSSLELNSSEIRGEGLESLAKLQHLRSLSVQSAYLNDQALAAAGRCQHLEYLTLQFGSLSRVDPRSFAELKRLPRLTWLDLYKEVSDDAMAEIAAIENLSGLSIYSYDLSDRGIEQLRDNATIQFLTLMKSERVTDQSIDILASMKGLKDLDVLDTAISSTGLDTLAASRPDITINR